MPPLDLLRRSPAGVRARAVADLGGRAPDGARPAPASDTTTAPDRGAGIFGRTSPSPASGPAPPSSAHPRATVSWNASSEPSRNSSAGSANSNPSGNATTPSGDGASSITKAGWSGNTDTGPPYRSGAISCCAPPERDRHHLPVRCIGDATPRALPGARRVLVCPRGRRAGRRGLMSNRCRERTSTA